MDDSSRSVLVVEDNAALASVVRFNLERAGFEVTVVYNGWAAWQLVQAERFQLVITDQQMPEMDGCEFCRRLRGLADYQQTPVIMLTAKGLELELSQLRDELGISVTFLKPFSPKEIIKAVEDQLAGAS